MAEGHDRHTGAHGVSMYLFFRRSDSELYAIGIVAGERSGHAYPPCDIRGDLDANADRYPVAHRARAAHGDGDRYAHHWAHTHRYVSGAAICRDVYAEAAN